MMIIPKNIVNYLHLKDVGGLELTFGMVPILSGYTFIGKPLSLLMWLLLIGIVLLQGKLRGLKFYVPLLLFVFYWFIHQVMISFADDLNINGFLAQFIYFLSVFTLYPVLNLEKLKGSLNWVALLSMGGLLYQWTFILRGQAVHPIELPGFTLSNFILEKMIMRPSSFFMEPSSYAAFMICPLALSLIERKYVWAVAIILSICLTTSTTGLVLSFVLLGASLFIQKKFKIKTSLGLLIIGGGLFFALTHFDVFEAGVEKFENTDASTNVRLSQGPYIVSTMYPSEWLFGVPYSTPYNYCISGRAPDVIYYGDSVYMSTFWQMILLFGIVGLLLYLNIYLQVLKSNRMTLPLILALCAVLFSSGYFIGGDYVFTLIILLVVARNISDTDGNKKMMARI